MARRKRACNYFYGYRYYTSSSRGLAYDATKNLVLLHFGKAINTMLEVTLIAGAIALGLLFADQISKIVISGFARTRKGL